MIAVLVGLCSLAGAQDTNPEEKFLSEIRRLGAREANGRPVDPASRLREDLGFSTDSANALLASSRDYVAGLTAIDEALRKSILERRMRAMAGENVVSEPELLAEASRRRGVLLERTMQELRSRLGTREGQNLRKFLEEGSLTNEYFPLRPGEALARARVN
jgi:hypothetical protein